MKLFSGSKVRRITSVQRFAKMVKRAEGIPSDCHKKGFFQGLSKIKMFFAATSGLENDSASQPR